MPMERSMSCAERGGSMYGGAAGAADIRSYSASYARPAAKQASSRVVKRARSLSSWTRPAPPPVERSGSIKSVAGGGGGARPSPGLNLRSYSASFAASYGPTVAVDGGAGGGQLKRSGSVTNWTSANRRSVNLRGYTPSFAALDDTATAAVPAAKKAAAAALDDAELQRRKRLVVYKTYDVEGKVRESVRRGVTWIKGKCSRVVYSWW